MLVSGEDSGVYFGVYFGLQRGFVFCSGRSLAQELAIFEFKKCRTKNALKLSQYVGPLLCGYEKILQEIILARTSGKLRDNPDLESLQIHRRRAEYGFGEYGFKHRTQ